jgi:HAMP domain-containing protein
LIAAFIVATLVPLAATIWIASSLLDRSLAYATTGDLDRLSRTMEGAARQFYQREREALSEDAASGRAAPQRFDPADAAGWPESLRSFWESGEAERFALSGTGGDHLDLMRRDGRGAVIYRRDLGGLHMEELSAEFRHTRELIAATAARDLRRGFNLTLLLLIAAVWLVSLAPLIFLAHRISRPIQQLTAGLTDFAAGDWDRRLLRARDDEVGRAVEAFNRMAEQLRRNRDRLVYLTQMTSWQLLARKTAHELKNSLTPIRLTVEEMVARQPAPDRAFMEQAAQIVIGEIETLERRVRSFSEFASEPDVKPAAVDSERGRGRTCRPLAARPSRDVVRVSACGAGSHRVCERRPRQGDSDESARERGGGGRVGRIGLDDNETRRRGGRRRSARLGSRPQ